MLQPTVLQVADNPDKMPDGLEGLCGCGGDGLEIARARIFNKNPKAKKFHKSTSIRTRGLSPKHPPGSASISVI
jgi:hypothetical protein